MPIFEDAVLRARQARFAGALEKDGPLVLVFSGEPIGIPGGIDMTYPFFPHPEYYWLSGSRRPGGVMAYDPRGGWTHFVKPADAVERLWEGEPEVPPGDDVAWLSEWLRARPGRAVALLGNTAGVVPAGVAVDPAIDAAVREKLDHVRRPKDEAELALLDRAVKATAAGFAKAREVIKPGATERAIRIEIEAEFFRHGGHGTGFGTIVGTGTHAAVLHFEPGDRVVAPSDLVLVDAGAEIDDYCADVTRAFPAGGRFTPEQQAIYDLVFEAHRAAVGLCRAGTEWHDVHRASATVFGRGLKDLGILEGPLDDLLESGAVALFFPHGIGHMVGLRVRDVGGKAPDRPEGRFCCGARVRIDMPLEVGFLMTVEPGLYFVPAILDDPERRARFKNSVAWSALDRWRSVGGVRIEDNVLITPNEPKVLTSAIPK